MRLLAFAVVGVLPLLSIAAPQRLQALTAFREGCWLDTRQQFPEAIAEFERAVRIDSAHAEAWFYLGNAYQASTNPLSKDAAGADRARQAYTGAIRAGLGEQRSPKELKAEALAALAQSHAAGPKQDAAAAVAAQQLVESFPPIRARSMSWRERMKISLNTTRRKRRMRTRENQHHPFRINGPQDDRMPIRC